MSVGLAMGLSALGSIASTAVNAAENERNRQFNAEQALLDRQFQSEMLTRNQEFNSAEASKLRDWQTKMSNTAHQREVSDLEAAGLNPVLSAMGTGASTGSASAASSSGIGGSSASYAGSLPAIAQQFSSLMNLYDSMRNTAEKSHFQNEMLDLKRERQRNYKGYFVVKK